MFPDVTTVSRGPARTGHDGSVTGTAFEFGTDGPARILVGLDGTDTSWRAAAYAAGLARRQGSALVVVYVGITSALAAQTAATAGAMMQTNAEVAEELEQLVVDGVRRVGIEARFVVRQGNPYKELLAVAEEMRVDAVVIGASSRSGRRFVGSLAGRLVRDSVWPVTVVP